MFNISRKGMYSDILKEYTTREMKLCRWDYYAKAGAIKSFEISMQRLLNNPMITDETHIRVLAVLEEIEKLSRAMATRRDQLPPFKKALVVQEQHTSPKLAGNTAHSFIVDEFELLDTLLDGHSEPEPENTSKEPKSPS